jgi:hypothetical protein
MTKKDPALNKHKGDIPHLVNIIKGFDSSVPAHIVNANKAELKKIYDNADLSEDEAALIETVLEKRAGPVDQN